MRPVLVVGGSGFIGSSIQDAVLASGRSDDYVFTYRTSAERVAPGLGSIQVDLLDPDSVLRLGEFDSAIWVAGSSDHGLAWVDPLGDLSCSAVTLLRFLDRFHGSLAMLSSQAVYFGLAGEIREEVDHVPSMPYGFGKLAAERYASWALDSGRLKNLWIHRLMYAFGPREKPRRLLARCIDASKDGSTVRIAGGGASFLNPLPATFLASVLLRSSEQLEREPEGFRETTNVNHPEKWSVFEVVEFLDSLGSFSHEVVDTGEDWPVAFHGNVERLSLWLEGWGMAFPDVEKSLREYRDFGIGRHNS